MFRAFSTEAARQTTVDTVHQGPQNEQCILTYIQIARLGPSHSSFESVCSWGESCRRPSPARKSRGRMSKEKGPKNVRHSYTSYSAVTVVSVR
jgi:hypothetical protein